MAGDLTYDPHSADPHSAGQAGDLAGAPQPSVPCLLCGAGLMPVPETVLRAAIPQSIAAAILRVSTLSARERTVLGWLGQGRDNRSIAREMNISERTVKRYVTLILGKLELESRLQAGLAALIISAAQRTPQVRINTSAEAHSPAQAEKHS